MTLISDESIAQAIMRANDRAKVFGEKRDACLVREGMRMVLEWQCLYPDEDTRCPDTMLTLVKNRRDPA